MDNPNINCYHNRLAKYYPPNPPLDKEISSLSHKYRAGAILFLNVNITMLIDDYILQWVTKCVVQCSGKSKCQKLNS